MFFIYVYQKIDSLENMELILKLIKLKIKIIQN